MGVHGPHGFVDYSPMPRISWTSWISIIQEMPVHDSRIRVVACAACSSSVEFSEAGDHWLCSGDAGCSIKRGDSGLPKLTQRGVEKFDESAHTEVDSG